MHDDSQRGIWLALEYDLIETQVMIARQWRWTTQRRRWTAPMPLCERAAWDRLEAAHETLARRIRGGFPLRAWQGWQVGLKLQGKRCVRHGTG
ncbi:MAG: hypothetical protein SF162_06530 [bacterium]|nr:hypothetical protein [bacterium]